MGGPDLHRNLRTASALPWTTLAYLLQVDATDYEGSDPDGEKLFAAANGAAVNRSCFAGTQGFGLLNGVPHGPGPCVN